jgi:hypothetical protein
LRGWEANRIPENVELFGPENAGRGGAVMKTDR